MLSILQAAGWPIWLLLVASIVATALIIERLLYLRRAKILPKQLLDEVVTVYRSGNITAVTATTTLSAPVTTTGMLKLSSGANPAQLAHGISVALYNTGFGLAIAMPTLVFYRHFRALVDSFVIEMEQQAVKFVDVVHLKRK